MSLPRYEKYKDSGVEWIGEIPEGWNSKRLKYVAYFSRGFDLSNSSFVIGDYPVYGSNGVIGYHNTFTTTAPSITVGRSGSVGEVHYITDDYWAHNTALYLLDNHGNQIRYLFYLLKTLDLKTYSEGTAVGTLNRNNIHEIVVAVPLLPEQTAIALFLDRKTAEIDQLIANKEKLIALYEEEKTAIINRAVTRGLDPDVTTKPSGVDWLGDIPEHWEVKRLKYVKAEVKNSFVDGPFGSHLKSEHFVNNGDVYVIDSGYITSGNFLHHKEFKTITNPNPQTSAGRTSGRVILG